MKRLPSIKIRNAQRKRRIDIEELQRFSKRACRLCLEVVSKAEGELATLQEVNIVLISDRRMAAVHKKFMNIVGPTDVLTFQHGEILVSVDTAQENAARFETTADEEIRLYILHGLLHLRGFADVDRAEAQLMNSVQQRILTAASEA